MMPVYRYMDSYPHQGTPVSSGQNFYPSIEAVPPHTKFDPSKPVIINQPWPYPNNFNYCVPCYPYSSDPHFPGYYGQGGFYPHPPTPQFHCCGHQYHPPFPGPLPAQYLPPPYYLREMPRYEFDKPSNNGQHCCGCPNHSHDQSGGGGVKIEEQEPNGCQSLVPSRGENFSHPVLLIPPEYMKNNEQRKHLESDGAAQEKSQREMRPHQNVKSNEQVPQEKYSWLPLDLKSLQSLLQGDNGRRTQQKDEDNVKQFPIDMKSLQSLLQGDNGRRTQEGEQKDEDNMKQFPFPIIWMTPNQKQGEGEEKGKINGFPAIIKDAVHGDSASPAKLLNNGRGTNEAPEIHDNASANTEPREKSTTQKIIPVKPVEVPKEREISEGAERRGRTVSPKNKSVSEMDKLSGAGLRKDSSSPPKSKLPPVCLRVDPLPRKKTSSASSRSPSPPASKGKLQEKGQTHQDSEARGSAPSSTKAVEEKHSSGAAIQGEGMKREEKKDEERRNEFTAIPVFPLVDSSDRKTQQNENVKSNTEGNKGSESGEGSATKEANEKNKTNDASRFTNAASEEEKKRLSADEAAICIQSAYRGYQVRNWEPMKKLKQIAEVREKMVELKNKIHSLESSPDLQNDEKQTAVIGEMIMRLLLKLDTIQGLPPSFRDVRKSLARELVMLQEKLDSLHKAIGTEKPSNNQEGKSGDVNEASIEGTPQLVNATSKNQDEETCKPPCATEYKQKETVNDVQKMDKVRNSLSNELKEAVNGELDSSVAVEHDRAAGEVTLLSLSEESVSDTIAEPESKCNDSSQKLDGSQGATSEELVASAEQQMGETVVQDKTDSASSEPGLLRKVDDSGDADQVVEIVNDLPIGVIEDEESQQYIQAGSPNSGDSAQAVEIVNELLIGVIEDEESQQYIQAGSPNSGDSAQAVEIVNELPIGVIEDEESQQYIQAGSPNSGDSAQAVEIVNELPIGVIEDEESQQHKQAGSPNSGDSAQVEDIVNELPIGVIEDEESQQHKQAGSPNDDGLLPDEDVREKSAADALEGLVEDSHPNEAHQEMEKINPMPMESFTSSADAEASNEKESEKQFTEESDNIEKEDNSCTEEIMLGGNLQESQAGDTTETSPDSALLPEKVIADEGQKEVNQETVDAIENDVPISGDEEQTEEVNADEVQKEVNQETNIADKSSISEAVNAVNVSESEKESSPLISTSDELSMKEREISVDEGKKLAEENEKMREMVKKLLESGKEQSAVISNLTGRLNELEQKLKQRKTKGRRHRRVVSSPSRKPLARKREVTADA